MIGKGTTKVVGGIEPPFQALQAGVVPLDHTTVIHFMMGGYLNGADTGNRTRDLSDHNRAR